MDILELLFSHLYLKMHTNVSCLSDDHIALGKVKKEIRLYILHCVLVEFKGLLINLIYYNSLGVLINYKVDRILQLIVYRVRVKLQNRFILKNNVSFLYLSEIKWLLKYAESEDGQLLKFLIHNLIFKHDTVVYSLKVLQPPKLLTSILENLIVNLADICSYTCILDPKYSYTFFEDTTMYYGNTFFLKSQTNNIYWQKYFKFTFLKPKYIYNNIYFLNVSTSRGIVKKVIYLPTGRISQLNHLSNLQHMVLFYFELIDFIYPRIYPVLNLVADLFSDKK